MKSLFAVAALVILAPRACLADDFFKSNEFSLHGGPFLVLTKIKADAEAPMGDTGFAAGLRYLRNITPEIALGADATFLVPSKHESTSLISRGITTTEFDTKTFLFLSRLRFNAGDVKPYVLTGIGIHSTSVKIQTQPQRGLVWADTGTTEARTLTKGSDTGVALSLQGGSDYRVNDRYSIGAFVAWHYMPNVEVGGLATLKESFSGLSFGASLSF
jgi:hypothetical protein